MKLFLDTADVAVIKVRTDQPFSFADGTLTANGRLRRSAILARHRDRIDALYIEAAAS